MAQNILTKAFHSQFVHIYDRNLNDPLKALQSMNRLRVPWIMSYINGVFNLDILPLTFNLSKEFTN